MARNRFGDRGGEPVNVKALGSGTRSVSTVPGDGRVKPGLSPRTHREGRSAARYADAASGRVGGPTAPRRSTR